MRTSQWGWVALVSTLLFCCFAKASAAEADGAGMSVYQDIVVIVAAGGFGGFVNGLLRQPSAHYTLMLPWPFSIGKEFGFFGDIAVGAAAGTSIFFVMESLFGLYANDLTKPQQFLKFIGLGVICGYMGSSLLDGLSMLISKRLAKLERDLEKEQLELEKLRKREEANTQAQQKLWLAAAYKKWGRLDEALEIYKEAVDAEPDDPYNYVEVSLAYAEKAEKTGDKSLYNDANIWIEKALLKDKQYARALYDRACYKHQLHRPIEEVLQDLRSAIKLNDIIKTIARLDPDFNDLHTDEKFKGLVGLVSFQELEAETAPHRVWWRWGRSVRRSPQQVQ